MKKGFIYLFALSTLLYGISAVAQDTSRAVGIITSIVPPPPGRGESEGIQFWMGGRQYVVYAMGLGRDSIGYLNNKQIKYSYKYRTPVCLVGISRYNGHPFQAERVLSANCKTNDF